MVHPGIFISGKDDTIQSLSTLLLPSSRSLYVKTTETSTSFLRYSVPYIHGDLRSFLCSWSQDVGVTRLGTVNEFTRPLSKRGISKAFRPFRRLWN